MSYGCMYILRSVNNLEQFIQKLKLLAKKRLFAYCLNPVNNLLIEHAVTLSDFDFVFEIIDNFECNTASLLLSYDNWTVNGCKAELPLLERLKILQDVVTLCLHFSDYVEVYIGEDTPYLPDYNTYHISGADVLSVLHAEYLASNDEASIPCIHLVVS